jgi:glutamate synthase domain-containing protein 1
MCGIAGFLQKDPNSTPRAADVLLDMLLALNRRGPDSAGVALYGPARTDGFVVRAWYGDDEERAAHAIEALKERWPLPTADLIAGYARIEITTDASAGDVARAIDDVGLAVFSVGRSLEVVKHELRADVLKETYGLGGFPARHGIGHTRMATESRVDVEHAHPFWARPFEDVAVVHNGHITNYHKLRRILEMNGYGFMTGNDTELIAVYIADKLAKGVSLDDAVGASIDELDGSFTYLIATPEGFGIARDRFACKPGVVYEDDEIVAVASEEQAIYHAIGDKRARTREVQAREVLTWAA